MDQKKLTTIAAACGGAVFVGVLLPWVTVSIGPMSQSASGTQVDTGTIILILGLLGGAAAALTAMGKTSAVPIAPKQQLMIALGALGLAALLTIIKFLDFGDGMGVASRGIGLWLTTLASIAGTVCAFLAFKNAGGTGSGGGGASSSGEGGE